ncbi:hypothetical protein PAHAL_7G107600 [Panicum hallii]|uniref:SIAH-type domain-containing protein n=1 Tax=Panicum hallii TaxID=206008 RepID=A0A2T8IBQ3_9POAL|nr:hypothetical protein PAHAL_7G107600 [Panicum hallii]
MSGDRGVAKFNFNCGQYGVALSNGVFTCGALHRSTQESCGHVLCYRCVQHHEEDFKHVIFRARYLDDIIASDTFVSFNEGCGHDISTPHYTQHQMVCPYKRLRCPMCSQWFTSIALSSHPLRRYQRYQFNYCQLEYGALVTGNDISKWGGCVFRGRGEDFVFFIAGISFYFL